LKPRAEKLEENNLLLREKLTKLEMQLKTKSDEVLKYEELSNKVLETEEYIDKIIEEKDAREEDLLNKMSNIADSYHK
jgi:hypothetical protein